MSLLVAFLVLFLSLASRPAQTQPLDPARSLFVTDRAVLDSAPGDLFALERVLAQLIAQSGVSRLTPERLWQQWWDTFNVQPGLRLGPHCDTQPVGGVPAFNGFPWQCPRQEGGEIAVHPFDPAGPAFYRTVALVNRFDLAPLTGAHCGEYRLVFARTPATISPRNLLILEAQLPNPTPELGVEGCRPVAAFWASLSTIDDPDARAQALAAFYFTGLAGSYGGVGAFPPVVSVAHYATGQVRTNSFIAPLWQLREFKLVATCPTPGGACTRLRLRPATVKDTPFGPLWNDRTPLTESLTLRRQVVKLLPGLLPDDVMQLVFQVSNRVNAGQSNSQGSENDYPLHLAQGTGAFPQQLQRALTAQGSDLTPEHLARRALTQSCAGCHQLSTVGAASDLGHGVRWPASLGFVHVDEQGRLSPALRDVFLPHRQAALEQFLAGTVALRALATAPGVAQTIGGPKRTH